MSEKEFDNFLEKYTDPPEPSFLDKITSYFDDRTAQVTQDYNIGSDAPEPTPEETYADEWSKQALTNVAESVVNWAKEAPGNYADTWEARNKILEQDPLSVIDEGLLDTTKAPPLTPEAQQAHKDYDIALEKLNNETVRPAVTVAAVLGVPGATLAYTPYMAKDILDTYAKEIEEKGLKKGMISGTFTNLKELTIGNIDYYLTDKEFNEKIKTEPGLFKDVLMETLDVGAGVRTALHPAIKRIATKRDLRNQQKQLIKTIAKELETMKHEPKISGDPEQPVWRDNRTDPGGNQARTSENPQRTELLSEREPTDLKGGQQNRTGRDTNSTHPRSDISETRSTPAGTPDVDMVHTKRTRLLDKLSEVEQPQRREDAKRTLEEALIEEPNMRSTAGRDIKPLPPESFSPVTDREITKFITDNFISLRFGNFMKGVGKGGVGAYFHNKLNTMRLKKYGKWGDAAHELGHFFDKQFEIEGADTELINNAREIWVNNEYREDQMRSEGIAEFTREYLLNPEEAKKNFPEYYQKFTKRLGDYPKYQKALPQLSNMLRSYSQQNPAQSLRATISFSSDRTPTKGERFLDFMDRMIYENFDDKCYIRHAEKLVEAAIGRPLKPTESPYVRARLLDGFVNGQTSLLIDGDATIDIDTLNRYFCDNKIKNKVVFNDILRPLADEVTLNTKYPTMLKDFNARSWNEVLSAYLVAEHNNEVYSVKGTERIAEAQLKYEELTKSYETKIEAAQGNPFTLLQITEDAAIKLGMEQAKLKELSQHPYDTPVQVVTARKVLSMPIPPEVKAAAKLYYAYTDNLLGILEAGQLIDAKTRKLLRETYPHYCPFQRDFSLESNKTFSSTNGLVDVKNGLHYLSNEGSTRTVIDPLNVTYVATKTALSRMHKNKLLLSLRDIANEHGYGALCEPVGHATAKTSAFTIYENGKAAAYQTTPELYTALQTFDTNFMQDCLGSIGNILAAVNKTIRITATNHPGFILTNGMRDTMQAAVISKEGFIPFMSSAANLQKLADKKMLSLYTASGVPYSTLRGSSLYDAGIIIKDQLTPKSKMRKGVEKAWQSYNKIGDTVEALPRKYEFTKTLQHTGDVYEAAYRAKEITIDFTKGGHASKFINRYTIPFYNAGILGAAKIFQQLTTKGERERFLIKGFLYLSIPSIISWQLNHNEDWYQELPSEQRNRFWYWGQLPDGTLVKTPKPLGLNTIFCTPTEATLEQFAGSGNTRLSNDNLLAEALDSLSPTGSWGLETGVAGLVKPAVEHKANYNFFRNSPVVPMRLQNRPAEEQYTVYTPEVYKNLGKEMEWSPLVIENYVNSWLTASGAFVADTADVLLKDNQEPAKHWNEYPVINRLFASPNKRTKSSEYYFKTVKYFETEKNSKSTVRNKKAKAALKAIKADRKEISALYKQQRAITENPKLTPEQKRQQIDKLETQILSKTDATNKKLYKYLPADKK